MPKDQKILALALCFPLLIWVFYAIEFHCGYDGMGITASIVGFVTKSSPVVLGDISIFKEIGPAAAASAIIIFIGRSTNKIHPIIIVLSILIYFAYLDLSIFFSSERGIALVEFISPDKHYESNLKIISGLIGNIRSTSIIVVAAIFGIQPRAKLNTNAV